MEALGAEALGRKVALALAQVHHDSTASDADDDRLQDELETLSSGGVSLHRDDEPGAARPANPLPPVAAVRSSECRAPRVPRGSSCAASARGGGRRSAAHPCTTTTSHRCRPGDSDSSAACA